MNPSVPGGRGSLLAVAILLFVSGLIIGNGVRDSDPEVMIETMRRAAWINFGLGLVFLALWAWAKRRPLKASAAGVALFLGVQTLNGILNPASLIIGFVSNAVILVFLIRSVVAARATAAWEKGRGR